VRASAVSSAWAAASAPRGSDEVGRFHILHAVSKAYDLTKAEPKSDWGKLAIGTRVVRATHTNNVGAVFFGEPNHHLRWYTTNPAEVVVPVEQVLHASFTMEAATLPPLGQEGWDIDEQRQAVNQGAAVLSEDDYQIIMKALTA